MTRRLALPCFAFALCLGVLAAQPLGRDATVYAAPEPDAPTLGLLAAGTTPKVAADVPAPTGWQPVLLAADYEVFVRNADVGKNLEIKPGAPLRLSPDLAAPVVGAMPRESKAELRGLRGDWTLFRLETELVGYVKLPAGAPAVTPAFVTTPAVAPVTGDAEAASGVSRTFEGRLAATRNFLNFRHPYAFQLLDANGNRFAYLDVGRLLLTEPIENYLDRTVMVRGLVRRLDNRFGIVLEVESMQLR
jgi:hypothetical protein